MRAKRLGLARVAAIATLLWTMAGCGGGSSSSPPTTPTPPAEAITITSDATIQYVLGVAFSKTLAVQGNATPVTWKILGGQLPTGLNLDSQTGTIAGTAAAQDGTPVTIQAADAKAMANKQFTLIGLQQLIILPVTPAAAHTNAPYSIGFQSLGSPVIVGWTISAGQLPPGLSLAANASDNARASITGKPSQTGTFSFTVQAQDNTLPQTATLDLTVAVDSKLTITNPQLKTAQQNLAYSDSFTVVNGTTPYHWVITGQIPAGLTLNASTGAVSGTPTSFGSTAYTVKVTDSATPANSATSTGFFNITEQPRIGASLPDAYLNQPYFQPVSVDAAVVPYTLTIVSGSLPPGLQLVQLRIQGTATQLGTYNFTVQMTDSDQPPFVVTQTVTIKVTPPPLIVDTPPLSPAAVNVPYHSQIPIRGGTPPYSWTIASGSLPPGLMLNATTGFIDGTPTQNGAFTFQPKVTDSSNPLETISPSEIIVVQTGMGRNDSIATATPWGNNSGTSLSISPYIDPINAGTANPDTDYYKLMAAGGSIVHVETFTDRISVTNLLDTVIEILAQDGSRMTTCTRPAYTSACLNDDIDSTTTDSALDVKVPGAASANTTFYVHVLDWRGDARPDMRYSLNVTGVFDPMTFFATLPTAQARGVNFQNQFGTVGGTGNITWSLAGGSLPTGWHLSASGLLSGVSTADGAFAFTIKATDSSTPAQTATAQYLIQIVEPLTITSSGTFPSACLNKPYTFQMQTAGGFPPFFFGIQTAEFPLQGNGSGLFSGQPNTLGTFTALVMATDSAQPASGQDQNVSVTVVNCP